MMAYLGYTLGMRTLFGADQLWLMTRIREEEDDASPVMRTYDSTFSVTLFCRFLLISTVFV